MTKANLTDASLFDRTAIKIKDKLYNVVANLGTNRDKQSHTSWEHIKIGKEVLEGLYGSDWAAGKIIDIPVDDMLRNWRFFPTLDPDQADLVKAEERRLMVKSNLSEGMKTGRLYGASIIIMGVEGAGELHEPLDPERITQGSLKFLHVLDRHDCSIHSINTWDVNAPNYRQPEFYTVNGLNEVHWTRVLRFDGQKLPWRMRKRNSYWGQSVLQRVHEALQNSQATAQSLASLVHKADVDVIKIPNFMHLASTKDGEKQIIERFALASLLMSNQNTLILDSQEEHSTRTTNLAGLKDYINQFLQIVSAAADIPLTRLLGQSPAGLNSTGDGDLENYYNMIEGCRIDDLEPQLCRLDEILIRSALGTFPEDYESEFNPLWQLSAKEKADIDKIKAETAQIYKNLGIIDQVVIAKQLNEENTYIGVNDEYVDDLEAAIDLAEELAQTMAVEASPEEAGEAGEESEGAGNGSEAQNNGSGNQAESEEGQA